MLDFSPEKMIFIFLIVMIVLGPEKLPEVSRKIGKAMAELRKLSGGFRDEMNKAVHEMTNESSAGGTLPSGSSSSGESSSGTSPIGAPAGVEIAPQASSGGSGGGDAPAD